MIGPVPVIVFGKLMRGGTFEASPRGARKQWRGALSGDERVLMQGFRIAKGKL
jgi:formylglycine-generating enzyme required for sulfatase activity